MKCTHQENCELGFVSDFLRIVSEENRLKIICYLQKRGESCVCDIQDFLSLPQNLVSHHLKVLKDFKLLVSRRDGLNVRYSVNHKELDNYLNIFNSIFSQGGK